MYLWSNNFNWSLYSFNHMNALKHVNISINVPGNKVGVHHVKKENLEPRVSENNNNWYTWFKFFHKIHYKMITTKLLTQI